MLRKVIERKINNTLKSFLLILLFVILSCKTKYEYLSFENSSKLNNNIFRCLSFKAGNDYTEVESINAANCNITDNSVSLLRVFPNLKNLNLHNNDIERLDGIPALQDLEVLDLSHNKSIDIKLVLENLYKNKILNIKKLYLTNTNLSELPETICQFKELEYIELSNNQTDSLPLCLCYMKNLMAIGIINNKAIYNPCLEKLFLFTH